MVVVPRRSEARSPRSPARRAGQDARRLVAVLALVLVAGGPPTALRAQAPEHRVFLPLLSPPLRRADRPLFSRTRGLQERPFALSLRAPDGLVIRYSLDGRAPAPDLGLIYTAPIPVSHSLVVRALAYGPEGDLAPSAVETHSYVFPESVFRQPADPPGLPGDWGVGVEMPELGPVAADYGMDPRVIDDPRYAPRLTKALRDLPSLMLTLDPEDLFGPERGIYRHATEEGPDWERPVSVELIRADGRDGFQVDAGLRMAGVASRHHQFTRKHSFSLRFRSRYGSPRLDYPLFPDSPVARFDTLRLRAGFNDSFAFVPWRGQYLRDAWGRSSQRDMGGLAPRGRFTHLFLNGLYWGLYEATEEPTAAFSADHLGGREADYDVVKSAERGEEGVEDGNRLAYERLIAMTDLADPVHYRQVADLLDIDAFADYMLLNIYSLNLDWQTNWRAARSRVTGFGFRFFSWDTEISLNLLQPGHRLYEPAYADDVSVTMGVDGLHDRLMRSPEYRQTFADRARRHLFDAGALTDGAAAARYRRLAAQIEDPMVLESARWGDSPPGGLARRDGGMLWDAYFAAKGPGAPQTQGQEWTAERDRLLRDFFPRRANRVLWQLCDRVLYPPLVAPVFEPGGGPLVAATRVLMFPDAGGCPGADRRGILYYTTDGSDPRLPGSGHPDIPWSGQIAHTAQAYQHPVALDGYTVLKARAALLHQGNLIWSALSEASYGSPRLAFDELHYQPPGEGQDLEFVEIVNLERQPVDLSGAATGGITYTFPAGALLAPAARAVLIRDPDAFTLRHPTVPVAGVYSGRLADEGEILTLTAAGGQPLAEAAYRSDGFWPQAPAGHGYSLVRSTGYGSAATPPEDPDAWRASTAAGGSPGRGDPPPPYAPAWINEVLPPPLPRLEGAVELFNPGPAPVDISGWWLSDDRSRLRKHRLPSGTVLPPGGHHVVYEIQWQQDPAPLQLAPAGGELLLSSADALGQPTGLLTGFGYGAAQPNRSFGRLATAAGPVVAPLAEPSLGSVAPENPAAFRLGRGAANGPVQRGPLMITELMVNPASGTEPEWIEIQNLSDRPLPLGGAVALPGAAALPWRLIDAVSFSFPPDAVLEPGQRALVTGGDPASLRALRRLPDELPIWGPWRGKLANEGESLAVGQPSDAGGGPALLVTDRVSYGSSAPWPAAATDGRGASLERVDVDRWGEDPAAWAAPSRDGTPGRPNAVPRRIWLPLGIRGR